MLSFPQSRAKRKKIIKGTGSGQRESLVKETGQWNGEEKVPEGHTKDAGKMSRSLKVVIVADWDSNDDELQQNWE